MKLFRWSVVGLALSCVAQALAESQTIAGIVLDPMGNGLGGAAVAATAQGRPAGVSVVSGVDGRFALELALGEYELRISARGFQSELRKVSVDGVNLAPLEIQLQLEAHRDDRWNSPPSQR